MTEQALFGAPAGGIVGSRRLIAVQTIDLGRLTHHPVPLVPSALVAVSGTGPDRDSNGSGKTTFLAAVSLLLGDPEWRIATSGGGDALGLLFDPDLSGDAAGLYDPAHIGYVAGVFAFSTADGHYDELTVWVRISSDDSPRLASRWSPGVHLAEERDQAAAIWNSLGKDRQIGPTALVEQLYGGTGRCLAYVTSRGTRDTDTSLMQLQARLSPGRIGSELIVLLGLEQLIDGERDLRSKLATAQDKLSNRIDEHERHEREWSATLEDISARDKARVAIAEGSRLWRLRTARKLLDVLDEYERLESERASSEEARGEIETTVTDLRRRLAELPSLDELQEIVRQAEEKHGSIDGRHDEQQELVFGVRGRVKQLTERLAELTVVAQTAPADVTIEVAESRAASAADDLESAIGDFAAAGLATTAARRELESVSSMGGADPVGRAALRQAGIEAEPLLDGIELDDEARPTWEPLLAPWRAGLLVDGDDRDLAVSAAPPGSVLVVAGGDDEFLPPGIRRAPNGAAAFLHALLGRSDLPFTDVDAGIVVAGGFEHQLCGREAALSRAQSQLERADAALRAAAGRRDRARSRKELMDREVLSLHAAKEVEELGSLERTLTSELQAAERRLADLKGARTNLSDQLVKARVGLHTASEVRAGVDSELRAAETELRELDDALANAGAAIERLDLNGWRAAWGGTDDEARVMLIEDDRREDTLRKRASEQLLFALTTIGVDLNTGEGAPAQPIAEVIRARQRLDEDVRYTNEVRRFDTVAEPLVNWLDDLTEHDDSFRQQVEEERARWQVQIDAARRERDGQLDGLGSRLDWLSAEGVVPVAVPVMGLEG
jgi:hypothetical protein